MDEHCIVVDRSAFNVIIDENDKLRSDNEMLLGLVHILWPLRQFVGKTDPIHATPIRLTDRGIVISPTKISPPTGPGAPIGRTEK